MTSLLSFSLVGVIDLRQLTIKNTTKPNVAVVH